MSARLSHELIVNSYHLLKRCDELSSLFPRAFIHRLKDRIAEIPGAFERPEPSRQYAARRVEKLARAFGRFALVRNGDVSAEHIQVNKVSFSKHAVFLFAAGVCAGRTNFFRIHFNER